MARLTDRPPAGSPPPANSPFLPPAQRPQLPPAAASLQQRSLAALVLAILSLLSMLLIGNLERGATVAAVALAVAAVALVLAITTMSATKQARTRRPRGALAGLVLSACGVLFSGCALGGFLIFSAQIDQYSNCMNGAITGTEQQACQTQLNNAITDRINALAGR
jgi:multisubunit Na+/H+ antiporter MnhB subunit